MTATPTICQSCGAVPREGARFCDSCGSQLAPPGAAAKYKQVTVLFADVVRSMSIAAALDVERLREIMTDLVERSAAVVRRYGGTVEYTGDGVMALFGAPVALEDHAFRACLAALAVQEEAHTLAAEVARRDGVELQLRVGLNSGRVIAGKFGSGSLGYRATGESVGLAKRIETATPPGLVLLSEATVLLVERVVVLGELQMVSIKGAEQPVPVRRLMAIGPRDGVFGRSEASLVGRRWEMVALDEILDRTISGRGGVVAVVGPPGIGKSRVARETAALASSRGLDVFWAFCESHARDVAFAAVVPLLRAAAGVAGLDAPAARAQLRSFVPTDADPQDLLLLDDLIGVADPGVPLPQVDPDARRRRLTAMVNSASLARTQPALYIIEDAHWIDAVSESMLADFLSVVPRAPSMVLITSRSEYHGALTRVAGEQTIALAPLDDSDTAVMLGELLGSDPSVGGLAAMITERAAGNPFFAEEIVRELVQRGVLAGERGGYACDTNAAEVVVPATVQAAIEARIDRLNQDAKQTLEAASVIGARFEAELLAALGIELVLDELLSAELIEQVRSGPNPVYAFRHPLVRAVAYESQLKSIRAEWHRRLAAAIQERESRSADENAALIAEHLEAAGDLRAAYGWHMRAGGWSTHRDIGAARVSWERACQIADALPADDSDRSAMRIAPRTLLCGAGWRVDAHIAGHFKELRGLCELAGDKASLALGMTGMVMDHMMSGRLREASRLASEQLALLEAIGDPALTVEAGSMAILIKYRTGDIADVLRWSQTVIDWADGDPAKGNRVVGSPLAVAMVWRGVARFWLGREGWRRDLDEAVVMARNSDPLTHALVVFWKYGWAITNGVLISDDTAVCELEAALRTAEELGDDSALGLLKYILGIASALRPDAADHHRGLELLAEVRDMCLSGRFYRSELPALEFHAAHERALCGDHDSAIPVIRKVVSDFFEDGQLAYGAVGTTALVQALLDRGSECDLAEAQSAIDRAAKLPADEGLVLRDVTLMPLRALLARARGDEFAYHDLAGRYRALAESLGFDGHIARAEAMSEGVD